MRFKDELSCNVAEFSFRLVFWGFMKPAGLQSSKVSMSKKRRSREDKKVIKSNLHFPQRKRRATNHSLHIPSRVPGQTVSLSEWEHFQLRLFGLIIYPQTDIFWLRPKISSHACVYFLPLPPHSGGQMEGTLRRGGLCVKTVIEMEKIVRQQKRETLFPIKLFWQ